MRPGIDQFVVFYYVADLARTKRFYEEVLGLSLVLDQGTCRIYRVAGQGFVGFCECAQPVATQSTIVTFVTQEVDEWAVYLKAQGVSLKMEPKHNPKYNIYHFFALDPDGYNLEFQTFLEPSWPAP